MRSPACFAILLALLGASCGGNVVVDSGTGGSSSPGLCLSSCQAVTAACPMSTPTDCAASCQKMDPLFDAACPTAYDAFLTCLENNATSLCGGAMACTSEEAQFSACYNQVCNPPTKCQ